MSNPDRRLVTVNATDQELSNLIVRLIDRIEALEAALREIARGEGPYSPGRYEHIKDLQEIARAALDKDEVPPGTR